MRPSKMPQPTGSDVIILGLWNWKSFCKTESLQFTRRLESHLQTIVMPYTSLWPTSTERLVRNTTTNLLENPDCVWELWTIIWTWPYTILMSYSIEKELGETISFILFSNTDIRMMSMREYERACQIWKGRKSDKPIFNDISKRPSKLQSKTKLS